MMQIKKVQGKVRMGVAIFSNIEGKIVHFSQLSNSLYGLSHFFFSSCHWFFYFSLLLNANTLKKEGGKNKREAFFFGC